MDAAYQIPGGLVLLALGGDGLIRGAVSIARRLGVSELLIGLTLVGFATSTPELITSVEAALIGSPGIAIGNVVGSNISNILLIFALVVLIKPITADPAATGRDGILVIVVSILLAALASIFGVLDRAVGGVLTGLLIVYLLVVWRLERKDGPAAALHEAESHLRDPAPQALWLSVLFVAGGLGLLLFGANLLVHGAITVARLAGLSETVIGLTIVAIGTSLPELVATLAAALKGRSEVAFGNILGSNIYNVLGILGITALVHPIAVPDDMGVIDWTTLIGSAVLLAIFARTGGRVTRLEGGVLLGLYVTYAAYLLMR